jgi:hypothetical protein
MKKSQALSIIAWEIKPLPHSLKQTLAPLTSHQAKTKQKEKKLIYPRFFKNRSFYSQLTRFVLADEAFNYLDIFFSL